MTICERMFAIMNKKGIKAVQLADKLNISQSVISNWRKRNTNPPIEHIINICEVLEISIYELLGVDDKKLTNKEELLLKYFRKCNPGNQDVILNATKSMQQAEPESEQGEQKLFDSKIG